MGEAMTDGGNIEELVQPDSEVPAVDCSDISSVTGLLTPSVDDDVIKKALSSHIKALAQKYSVDGYKLLFLFDERDEISSWHADRIYSATNNGEKKDILLLIQSRGGQIEPAYLISKTCARLASEKFVVAVPRKAKSAATLIALGAHEIHMGLMSELGPIDPQVGGLPALGMQNALTVLADLSCKYPGSSEMLGKFLSEKLDLPLLGYFERVSESAIQYAERLLENKQLPQGQSPKALANHFVNHYKDHGFVIDAEEAEKLMGGKIVRQNTDEYQFANQLHQSLVLLSLLMSIVSKKEFDLVGDMDTGMVIRVKKQKKS